MTRQAWRSRQYFSLYTYTHIYTYSTLLFCFLFLFYFLFSWHQERYLGGNDGVLMPLAYPVFWNEDEGATSDEREMNEAGEANAICFICQVLWQAYTPVTSTVF